MLEIKCPPVRKIDGIIPHNYWLQMQLQLETCDLEECDFLECKLVEYADEEEYYEDEDECEYAWWSCCQPSGRDGVLNVQGCKKQVETSEHG